MTDQEKTLLAAQVRAIVAIADAVSKMSRAFEGATAELLRQAHQMGLDPDACLPAKDES